MMEKAPKTIKVTPDSELVRILREAISDGVPLVVDTGEEKYPVRPGPGSMNEEPKSKRAKIRLMSLAGAWSDLDADRMIEELYKARHEAPPSDPLKA
jgi:hypothetical protein